MLDATTMPEYPAASRAATDLRRRAVVWVLLAFIMLAGGYFRFVGLNWDDYIHFHPDERFLASVASGLGRPLAPLWMTRSPEENQAQYQRCVERYPQTEGTGDYFDAECSPWNPHNIGHGLYVYGTLPLFAARWTGDVVTNLTGDPVWVSYDGVHLVWRFLSALSDMGVIVLVFLIGAHLHNRWTGLASAALYAGAVFAIQQAHFGTTDAMTNLFVTLALLFVIRVQTGGALVDYLLFGLAAGAALASRVNTAPIVGLIMLVALVRALPVFEGGLARGERERLLIGSFVGLLTAGLASFIIFRVFNPYTFSGPGFFGLLPYGRWFDDIGQAQYLVSGAAEIPPNWQWVGRTAYLYPWQNMVLWGMGVGLGLTGWIAWAWAGVRLLRGRPGALQHLVLVVWVLVYFALLGRSWVSTMRYFLPLYPALAVLAGWLLIELIQRASRPQFRAWRRVATAALTVAVVGFTLLWAGMFTNIYRSLFTAAQAGMWVWENTPGDFAMQIDNAEPGTPLINIALANGFGVENDIASQASRLEDGQNYAYEFVAPASGIISSITALHLGDPLDDSTPESIRIRVSQVGQTEALAEATLTDNFSRQNHSVGDRYQIPFERPLIVVEGERYVFDVRVEAGGPIITAGAIFSWEGDWDEPVPPKICTPPDGITLADNPPPGMFNAQNCNGRDAWSGLINGFKLQIIYDDVQLKLDLMQRALDDSDYLIIGTNRRYDSQSRLPGRWPMTERYYEALFNGELGFEVAAIFQETFELGPLHVSNQHLPIYDSPGWLNEFEAEEAFHVYDHPVVFIFRKTDAYSPENTAHILGEVPLNTAAPLQFNCPEAADMPMVNYYCDPTLIGVSPLKAEGVDYSLSADAAPTSLTFPDEMRQRQYGNGTWGSRFNADSFLNQNPVLLVIVWWLTITAIGWAAFPLLFTLLPGLADRGYGFAKIMGLFLTGWIAWIFASARVPLWSPAGVLIALVLLVAISGTVALQLQRGLSLPAYIRQHWRRLLGIEGITLVAFLAFLAVRLTNPDLWHPSFGGEKPMDFAYFNGVLRSTVFPPVDPWYAGGYINYYYFGFVIVGVPVLLLGVVPSIAYNLIIPTLFAATGIAAFSAAFNLVAGWHRRRADTDEDEQPIGERLGSPWVAGIAALLLAVVLGNLDTPRVFLTELARMGGYTAPPGLEQHLVNRYIEQYGVEPIGEARLALIERAQQSQMIDRVPYEVSAALEGVGSVFNALVRIFQGEPFGVSPDRWFWAPTRILAEPPVDSGQAIAEMPYFTFLYGDLHAHMIAMPLQLFVVGFLLNELLLAGRDRRAKTALWLAVGVGALTVGMLRATNTWDWITHLLLGTAGLGFAWWLRWRTITRASLTHLLLYVGGFIALHALLSLPYTTWYAATYGSVHLWEGNRTPLWAYFDIHGLFLFLIVCLLLWDTGRWLREVYVRSLRGKFALLLAGALIVGALLLGALILSMVGYQVTLIALPLLVWTAILFFRGGQSRPMQFALALIGLGIGLTLGVEYVVLAGDIGRQNTVFKFYIQAWLLFSVVGGAAFAWLLKSSDHWSIGLRNAWFSVTMLLVFTAALFPLMATPGKAAFRMAPAMPITLDGMDYMRHAVQYEGSPPVLARDTSLAPFELDSDYNIIRWLQDNVEGTPVIMEGRSEREYLWGSRISIYTGLPSVVGWNWHQRQQRTFNPLPRLVEQRVANVNAFYMTTDIATAWDILEFYDVRYIIVGALERAYYPQSSLDKFTRMVEMGLVEVVFAEDNAYIYRIVEDAELERTNERAGLVGS
jgi:YYY domain-containing protein